MAKWVLKNRTAGGDPEQYWDKNGEEVFLITAHRRSGKGDTADALPRRLVGMGPTRDSARRSLGDALQRYDASHTIITPR